MNERFVACIFLYIETERWSMVANLSELKSDVGITVFVRIFEELSCG